MWDRIDGCVTRDVAAETRLGEPFPTYACVEDSIIGKSPQQESGILNSRYSHAPMGQRQAVGELAQRFGMNLPGSIIRGKPMTTPHPLHKPHQGTLRSVVLAICASV